MPTVVSKSELDELKELINQHIEDTGESVGDFAKRCGVNRNFISHLRTGSYTSSPQLENVGRILKALGKRIIIVDDAE